MRNNGSTLFKVAGILAIVFGSLWCLGFIIVFPLLVGIPLIIGGTQFLKYAEMSNGQILERQGGIIAWIVVFFLGGTLLGILALLAYLNVSNVRTNVNFETAASNTDNTIEVTGKIKTDSQSEDIIAKLERLNELKEQGLINEEEYAILKNDLLKKK